ncbi:MAG: protein-disulfide reductase DsbD [Alteromonadaceae bacterium]|nr:protein-disulfide reductase DsbD [Alteromonadaceae bacterium]
MRLIALMLISLTLFPLYSSAQQSIFDTSSSSLFSNDHEFLNVEEAFEFNFNQENNKLTIRFNIAEGYYLYRHQFRFNAENATLSPIDLPQGEAHEDEFFGIQQIYTGELSFDIFIEQANDISNVTIRYQGCAKKGLCYPPTTNTVVLDTVTADSPQQAILSALKTAESPIKNAQIQTVPVKKIAHVSEQNQLASMLQQDSLWLTLVAFFVGGLLLSFTPCVFPMYPILTGIIVGQAKNSSTPLTTKKAFTLSFFYVQGMAVTYTILGVVVALAGAQFQAMFQHPAVLIVLSILFVVLALSMFGVFNLALPRSWQNKLYNISNKQKGGSVTGVVMMGVISGLVASPCTTAPLTGALLYISQSGDVLLGASALYALSLGMGLPLLILGSSGGKILPKAGNWMTIIKNVFGFLLLAVPILLLDRIIPAVATQILTAILILATAGYFYVANHNSAKNASTDNPMSFWYGIRSVLIFMMMFTGTILIYQTINPTQPSNSITEQSADPFIHVSSIAELEETISNANMQGKTVMVDLYADWCIACKEFEHYTFNTPQVQQALANTVLVQVDLTDYSHPLWKHYKVTGLPSILFFNLQGQELNKNRVTGFLNADKFAAHVRAIF